ncbi:MAG: hypothetical protein RL497_410 [Pseudomonadota bacterium]|jgi:uncharacterized protein (DUF934 family)
MSDLTNQAPKLLKNGQFVNNPWTIAEKGRLEALSDYTLVHLSDWAEAAKAGTLCGLWLGAEDSVDELPSNIKNIPVIAINFPAFMDGRGFSTARQIRERKEYSGELRAIGQFFQDQVFMMKRCGFDAYLVPADADLDSYKTTLGLMTDYYQAAADEPRPLFRRR